MRRQSTYLRRALELLQERSDWRVHGIDEGADEGPFIVHTPDEVIERFADLSDAYILVHRDSGSKTYTGWIRCIWQGPDNTYTEEMEIISDYSLNHGLGGSLEAVIDILREPCTHQHRALSVACRDCDQTLSVVVSPEQHLKALDTATAKMWEGTPFGIAASYNNTTWNDPRMTEEVRQHWRDQVAVAIAAYQEALTVTP